MGYNERSRSLDCKAPAWASDCTDPSLYQTSLFLLCNPSVRACVIVRRQNHGAYTLWHKPSTPVREDVA